MILQPASKLAASLLTAKTSASNGKEAEIQELVHQTETTKD